MDGHNSIGVIAPFFRVVLDEKVERVVMNEGTEDCFALGGIGYFGDDPLSDLLEFLHEIAMPLGEDLFEFFPDVSGICGTVSVCTDGNLKGTSLYYGGYKEITKLGFVDDVAENLKLLAVVVDAFVE